MRPETRIRRSFSSALEAPAPELLRLQAAWADEAAPQAPLITAEETAPIATLAEAEALGQRVAARLREQGAASA